MEQLIATIQGLNVPQEYKDVLIKEVKRIEKKMIVAEFKYNRTLKDKAAITNVLNTTIEEIDKQKKIIEQAKNEISQNLAELDIQKRLIEEKNGELTQTLEELKSAQAQLIQAEKMASLGELTAGIAHEIKNPMNFVNNYSELSAELLEEMKGELRAGNTEAAMDLANNIEQNLQKIFHHGKRANGIINGMLEHARMSTGKREPTDINVLIEEHLQLSYHGLRARNQSITTTLQTQFDENIGKINIIPQDIGRVMINLFNNAFYSIAQKHKELGAGYQPVISVTTKKETNKILIDIRDNGIGIPSKIVEKIFQPFFTTKPPGEGTGLGLSISYDIITKIHGGDIKVNTVQGSYTEFIIRLPLQ